MSGGSYNYRYCDVEDEYVGRMYDPELDELIKDLVPVLKAVEWWKSCDTCERSYREAVKKFKDKWLSGNTRTDRLTEIINGKVEELRKDLLTMIGVIDYENGGDGDGN